MFLTEAELKQIKQISQYLNRLEARRATTQKEKDMKTLIKKSEANLDKIIDLSQNK